MDKDSKKILVKVLSDVVCLAVVGLPINYFFLFVEPYHRGFFCGDESISYPFHSSTVPSFMLYTVGLGLPIITMLVTEFLKYKHSNPKKPNYVLFGWQIQPWLWNSYCAIGYFGFGAACSQLTTDIAKYSIGRLRPHFFDVCQPDIDCSLATNRNRYITDVNCTSGKQALIHAARLSFPSGHSSFSFYTMVYLVIYIQKNYTARKVTLLKHVFQFGCLMLAWSTALSRVSNYKHHWSDVLVGSLQGALVAVLICQYVVGSKNVYSYDQYGRAMIRRSNKMDCDIGQNKLV
ncbi:putative phosphatidate phosphatase isoform X2 [Nilaparvata lugens]|uniref:putative phosphatidate phosphatase isoform X2 n=1 Tax=Nilaparvata lugens TaxID=108931 RepID=UPI000B99C1AB|nr:putative phosphatidate phosphatase isoform X2 [Nilaparvata lugens]